MYEERTIIKHGYFGDQRLTLTSCVYDGEVLDTVVRLGDSVICAIAGSQRDEFLDELGKLVDNYRI